MKYPSEKVVREEKVAEAIFVELVVENQSSATRWRISNEALVKIAFDAAEEFMAEGIRRREQ